MKIKNTFKRIIALLTSLLIVISATSGAIYTFAAISSSDYTIDTSALDNDKVAAMGESIVASVEVTNTLDGGANFTKQNVSTTGRLIDGNVAGDQFELYNNPVKDGILNKGYFHDYEVTDEASKYEPSNIKAKYTDGTLRKVRITLALKGKANVKNVILAHAGGSGETAGALSLGNYALFAADTKDDLYDKTKASFYHLYDNVAANKKYQNYKFNDDKLTGVRYIGIEIYNPHIDWQDWYVRDYGSSIFYPRLFQFNAFGEIMPENVTYDDGELLTATEKGDLTLVSSSISVKTYRNGVQYAGGKDCANIIDESLDTKVEFMQSGAATNDYAFYAKGVGGVKFTEGGEPVDVTANFTIKVRDNTTIKKLVFVNSSPTTSKGNFATDYEIYAANTEADLYKAENRIEHIVNTELKKRQIIDITDGLNAKYIGFRIIEPLDPATFAHFNNTSTADNYAVPRIAQLGVYGVNNNEIENAEITRLTDKTIPTDIGTSLTGSSTVAEVRSYSNYVKTVVTRDTAPLYDGNTDGTCYESHGQGVILTEGGTKVVKTYNEGYYYEIEYDLGSYDTVKKVFVATHQDTNGQGLRAQSYEIYASNDKVALWTEANKVAYVATNNSVSQVINFKEAVSARYVGMRVLEPISQSTTLSQYGYLRLYEFGVYGTKGSSAAKDPQEGASLPMPTGESVVESTSAYYYNGSQRNSVGLANPADLYDGALPGSTMGSNTQSPFAYKDGSVTKYYTDRYMDIVLNLKGNCNLTDIYIAHHSNPDLMTKEYKLYIGDDKDALFDGTPYYVCDNNDSKQIQHYTLNGVTGKYVGIRITKAVGTSGSAADANNCYVRLFEFNAYGTVIPDSSGDWTYKKVTNLNSHTFPNGISFDGLTYLNHKDTTIKANSTWGTNEMATPSAGAMVSADNMSDGDFATQNMLGVKFAEIEEGTNTVKDYTKGRVRYQTVWYDLKSEADLSFINIAFPTNTIWAAGEYEVYIGNDEATLFDGTPYATVDNYSLRKNSGTETKMNVIAFDKTDSTPDTARYVGIKIYNPVCVDLGADSLTNVNKDQNHIYGRIHEFQIYGNYLDPDFDPIGKWQHQTVTYLTSHTLPRGLSFDGLKFLNHKDNSIKAKSSWADTGSEPQNASMSSFENMADGDYKTQNMLGTKFAIYDESEGVKDYTKGRVRYQTVWYDLKSEAELKFLNIAFPTNSIWAAGDYEVYISNDKDTLFEGDPYATVDNYNKRKNEGVNSIMNVIAFDAGVSARYVGVKIYNPIAVDVGADSQTKVVDNQHNIYGRIQELQIYGKYLDETFDPSKTEHKIKTTAEFGDLSKLPEVYGDNLLNSKKMNAYINTKNPLTSSHHNKLKPIIDRKGDELNAGHVDFSEVTEGAGYLIYFKLTEWELTQINGFIFQGPKSASANSSYFASDYEVYVLEERDDLATAKPVFHYTAEEYPLSNGQIIEFPEGKQPQGNWLVFKMNNPVYSATAHPYMRLSLLYAWGEEAIVKGAPGNIAENMPCDISFLNGSKRTPASEKNLTPKELGYITDSITHVDEYGYKTYETNLETYGKIDTKGKDRDTLEMVYNLCSDSKIDKIMVSALINNKTGFKTMKVYASTLLQGVYDEDSLIWTYKVSDTGVINPTKVFKKAKEMRYVRFVFEDTKDEVVLYTIDVIGMDNQKMKTRNIATTLSGDSITVEKIDLKTGKRSFYANTYPTVLSALFDSDDQNFLSFEEGEVGKHGYSLIIDLGDLKTISKLELVFNFGYEEYWAKKVEVYVLENKDQLTTVTEADYTFNPQKMSGYIKELSMRPRLARYIKLDFLAFPKNEYFKMPDGTYKITSAIADLKITGTKVKGMQRDEGDDRLISFVDKKTKAEISLVKLDNNDIFTNAVSARLVPEKATNWQMDSQMAYNYKIVDKTIYKIELLDLYGNIVTDIGERMIQVRFPIKSSEKGKMLIGDASSKLEVVGLDAFEVGNEICANVTKKPNGDTKVALLKLTTSTDPYWSEIGELEDFEVEEQEEDRDASWYDSIHTTDGRFVVTPLNDVFESGVRFTATDITVKNAYNDYYNVLEAAYAADPSAMDLQVAVFYDMKLTRNGANVELTDGAAADIFYTIPEFVSNNYTDLRAVYVADTGEATVLWSQDLYDTFNFQVEKMGKVALVGTKLSGTDAGIVVGDSPETGESRAATAAVVSLMAAAAFVCTISAKRNKAENK